ncbi:DUF1534 domain-containing protein [Pseudomonas sp. ADAK2]|nr:DUF1534 domain-containing protein [Pseudomonas sp. ADAK7]QJI51794.1 DUF1534 domain-containing protein [Pseudomonas sp. ADAK2]
MRGNAARDALRHHSKAGRRASDDAFPRGAWNDHCWTCRSKACPRRGRYRRRKITAR